MIPASKGRHLSKGDSTSHRDISLRAPSPYRASQASYMLEHPRNRLGLAEPETAQD